MDYARRSDNNAIRKGSAADLSVLRAAFHQQTTQQGTTTTTTTTSSNLHNDTQQPPVIINKMMDTSSAQEIALEQFLDKAVDEHILQPPLFVTSCYSYHGPQQPSTLHTDACVDATTATTTTTAASDPVVSTTTSGSSSSVSVQQLICQGMLAVTSERVLFWCDGDDAKNNRDHHQEEEGDLIVPAVCIELHAISSSYNNNNHDDDDAVSEGKESNKDEPLPATADEATATTTATDMKDSCCSALYIQLCSESAGRSSSGDPEIADLIEWTLTPRNLSSDEHEHEAVTQTLFDAFSRLIALHPIDPNDDLECMNDDEDYYQDDDDENDDENDDDDEMIVAPSRFDSAFDGCGNDGDGDADNDLEATNEERNAMLERLDRILVVPPELEQEMLVKDECHSNYLNSFVEGQFEDADEEEEEDVQAGNDSVNNGNHTTDAGKGRVEEKCEDDDDDAIL